MQNKMITSALTRILHGRSYQSTISRNAAKLSFKVLGAHSADPDKTPIMLLHGFLSNKKIWHSVAKVMKMTMKRLVVTVDLRNHGVSPHTRSHTYDKMVEDIKHLYKKLSLDEAFLVGYCMGGTAAMYLALLAPEQVSALLVVEVSPASLSPDFTEFYPKVLTAMKNVDFKNPKTIRNARKRAKEQLKAIIQDDNMMNAVLSNVNLKPDHTIGWTCNLDVLTKDFKYLTTFPKKLKGKRYDGPTLFIGGQNSDCIPPDDLTKIRMMFPQAIIHYIPNSGHYVHMDDPKRFIELVMNFIRETNIA